MLGRGNAPWRLFLVLSFGLASCAGRGKPVKVEGVLTLDGKPFAGATITLMPAESNGRSANGLSEADGSFRLTTFKPDDGALPGEYKVTVTYLESDKTMDRGDPNEMDNKAKMAMFSRMSPDGKAKDVARQKKAPKIVPEVYTDLNRTPLKCTVPVDGKLELPLRSTAH
jgi:hypothetical protein